MKFVRHDPFPLPKMTIERAYDLFIQSRKVFCSSATVGIYEFQRKTITAGIKTDTIENTTPDDIRALLAEYRQTHNDGGTFRLYSSIRAFYHWYWSEYDIEISNPIDKVKCKKPPVIPIQGITRAEIDRLLSAVRKKSKFPERDTAIILILADTGLRKSSVCNLRFKDVNVEACTLFVFEKDQQYHSKPFGMVTQRALKRYLRCFEDICTTELLWRNLDGSALLPDGIRQMLQRMENEAELPHYQFHAFRRFYGLSLYQKTHDIFFVSRALDHKNVEVTKRYLAIDELEDKNAVRSMSPMDRR